MPASQGELSTHTRMASLLQEAERVLEQLHGYQGCQTHVQKAISAPTEANLNEAWDNLQVRGHCMCLSGSI